MSIRVFPSNTFSGPIHHLGDIQLRFALEPGLEQVIHLILPGHTMETLIFFFILIMAFLKSEVGG